MSPVLPFAKNTSMLHDEMHKRPALPVETETAEVWCWVIKDTGIEPRWDLVSTDEFHTSSLLSDGVLRWEKHTEFVTATFVGTGKPSKETIDRIRKIDGKLWTATKISIEPDDPTNPDCDVDTLGKTRSCGSICTPYNFKVFTDFIHQNDGSVHYKIRGNFKDANARGRFTRRIIELEIYRFVALLGINEVRQRLAILDQLEGAFSKALKKFEQAEGSVQPFKLQELTNLSLEVIKLQDDMRYRIGATKAYKEIVDKRLGALEEQRLDQRETLSTFINQRLDPAVNTIIAYQVRLSELETSVRTALALARTIIDREIQQQNLGLLRNMEARATEQLKLSRAVESFSIIAITYYAISLLSYMFKPIEFQSQSLLLAGAIPIVAAVVWLLFRVVSHDKSD